MNTIHTLTLRFSNELKSSEIPYFRGAVIHAMDDANLLFHNHTEDGLRYRYPLIQYKTLNGRAAIVCLEEGTDTIGDFFTASHFEVNIGKRRTVLNVDDINICETPLHAVDDLITYRLHKWIPFNQENYRTYTSTESIADKYAMLERLLTGNILSFAKGLNIHVDDTIVVRITDIGDQCSYLYKGVRMIGFNLSFKSNITLPEAVGLGKGVSLGFGTVEILK